MAESFTRETVSRNVCFVRVLGQEESSLSFVTLGKPNGHCGISKKTREDLRAADTLTCCSSIKS